MWVKLRHAGCSVNVGCPSPHVVEVNLRPLFVRLGETHPPPHPTWDKAEGAAEFCRLMGNTEGQAARQRVWCGCLEEEIQDNGCGWGIELGCPLVLP